MEATTESKPQPKKSVHAIATEHVIGHLKRGIVPWLKQWTEEGAPQDLINHIEYRFINVFLLAILGYRKNFFITAKQLEKIGGAVNKKEKGYPVFYWKWPEKSENGGVPAGSPQEKECLVSQQLVRHFCFCGKHVGNKSRPFRLTTYFF